MSIKLNPTSTRSPFTIENQGLPVLNMSDNPNEVNNMDILMQTGKLKEMDTGTYDNGTYPIKIGGDRDFIVDITVALDKIQDTHIGRRLFLYISKLLPEGQHLDLRQDANCYQFRTHNLDEADRKSINLKEDINIIAMSTSFTDRHDDIDLDTVLFHEMTHFLHSLQGKLIDDALARNIADPGHAPVNFEEIRTTGVDSDFDGDGNYSEQDIDWIYKGINGNHYRRQRPEASRSRLHYSPKSSLEFKGDASNPDDIIAYEKEAVKDLFEN